MRIIIFPGMRLLDVTGPIEAFTSANDFGARHRLELVSEDGRDVITSGGTRLGAVGPADQGRCVRGGRPPAD